MTAAVFPGHVYHVLPYVHVTGNFTRSPDDVVVGVAENVKVGDFGGEVEAGGYKLLCSGNGEELKIEGVPKQGAFPRAGHWGHAVTW